MTSKSLAGAAAASFAHLLGRTAKRAEEDDRREDDEDEKAQRADESDEDYAKRCEDDEGEEDKEEKEKPDGKKAKKAKKGGDDDEEDDDEEDDEKAEKDDDEEEMKGKGAAAQARRRERARCSAIFACKAAGARPDVAAHLAFETELSRSQAIALLASVSAGTPSKRQSLADRMATVNTPKIGAGGSAPPPAPGSLQDVVGRAQAAYKKATGQV